jgi:hypothetical protein
MTLHYGTITKNMVPSQKKNHLIIFSPGIGIPISTIIIQTRHAESLKPKNRLNQKGGRI